MSLCKSDWMLSMYLNSFKNQKKSSGFWEGRNEYMKQDIEDQCVEAVIEKAAKRRHFISGRRCGKSLANTVEMYRFLTEKGEGE